MISIITPTYNEERGIAATLQRFTRNFTIPHELIVSDAGSKDATVAIAKQFADTVTVYPGAHPPTIATGRNDGAKLARGEFLVFLDADCIIEDPNKFFTEALARFAENKKLVALAVKIQILPQEATLADKFFCGLMNCLYYTMNNILYIGAATGEFQMMRTSAFKAVDGFREDLVTTEDTNMFYRLSKIGRTKLDTRLVVFNDGRRPHTIGWPRLLFAWMANTFSVIFLGKAHSKVWKAIR